MKTLPELVAWLRENPKMAFFASPAAGATPHFVGTMFAHTAGLELTHASYRGDAPGIQDLLGGQIACSVNNIGVILPHLKGGRARVATSGAKRSCFTANVSDIRGGGIQGCRGVGAVRLRDALVLAVGRPTPERFALDRLWRPGRDTSSRHVSGLLEACQCDADQCACCFRMMASLSR